MFKPNQEKIQKIKYIVDRIERHILKMFILNPTLDFLCIHVQ